MKKYLRSILCLLMALSVVFCFAACSDKEDDEDEEDEGSSIAGTYVLDSMESDGEEMTAEDLEDVGISPEAFYIVLDEDGTGTSCIEGDEEEIEWDDEELTDSTGESVSYTVKGSKLTIEIEGMTMTFKKTNKKITAKEEEQVEPAPAVSSTTYSIYAMTMNGVTMSGSDLAAGNITAANTYLTLNSDGTGELAAMGEVSDMGWNNAGIWPASDTTDIASMTIDGDVVTIAADDFTMVFVKNGSNATPTITAPTSGTPAAGKYSLIAMNDGTTTYEGATLDLAVAALELDSIDDLMCLEINADGTGKLIAMGIEGNIQFNETHWWIEGAESESIAYTYVNGELSFSMEGYTYTFAQK